MLNEAVAHIIWTTMFFPVYFKKQKLYKLDVSILVPNFNTLCKKHILFIFVNFGISQFFSLSQWKVSSLRPAFSLHQFEFFQSKLNFPVEKSKLNYTLASENKKLF